MTEETIDLTCNEVILEDFIEPQPATSASATSEINCVQLEVSYSGTAKRKTFTLISEESEDSLEGSRGLEDKGPKHIRRRPKRSRSTNKRHKGREPQSLLRLDLGNENQDEEDVGPPSPKLVHKDPLHTVLPIEVLVALSHLVQII